jgi:hypothetical protein
MIITLSPASFNICFFVQKETRAYGVGQRPGPCVVISVVARARKSPGPVDLVRQTDSVKGLLLFPAANPSYLSPPACLKKTRTRNRQDQNGGWHLFI